MWDPWNITGLQAIAFDFIVQLFSVLFKGKYLKQQNILYEHHSPHTPCPKPEPLTYTQMEGSIAGNLIAREPIH